jgi:phage N-6-adenine-methyltransferase
MTQEARTGPSMNRGRSKQDYGTPRVLLDAVEARFGPIVCDLAATAENKVTGLFYGPEDDSLRQDWAGDFPDGNLWLNPPFGGIYDWAEKCRKESKRRTGHILFLTPASIGTMWFADNVKKHAYVLALTPRLTFNGATDPYPKDCILSVFGHGFRGFDMWHWQHTLQRQSNEP